MSDKFETILGDIGSFGLYQVMIWFFLSLGDFSTSLTMLLPVFVSAKPSWLCPVVGNGTTMIGNDTMHHMATNTRRVMVLPTSGRTNTTVSYHIGHYDNNTSNVTLVPNVCTADNGVCPGIVYSKDFTSIVSEWNLVCRSAYIPDRIVTTVQMVGVLIGAVTISQLSDMFGRKKNWFGCVLVNILIGIGSVFVNFWEFFAVTRFFAGMCIGGLLAIQQVYPVEFVGPSWRPFTSVIGFWCLGQMLLSLMAYYIRTWQYLILATALPQILLLLGIWFIPESPRWLAMHQRLDESHKVLSKIATINKKPKPDISALQNFVEEEAMKIKTSQRYTYKDLFRTPTMTKNIAILMYTWFVCTGVYYGISFNVKNLTGDRYINIFLFGLIEFPITSSPVLLSKWIGRKSIAFGFFMSGGVSLLIIFILDTTGNFESYASLVNALAIFGRGAVSAAWSIVTLCVTELFPTVVRTTAMGAANLAGRTGGITAPLIVSLSETSKLLPYIIFGVLAITSSILVLILPETRGKPLPDNVPEWGWRKKKEIEKDEVMQPKLPLGDTKL